MFYFILLSYLLYSTLYFVLAILKHFIKCLDYLIETKKVRKQQTDGVSNSSVSAVTPAMLLFCQHAEIDYCPCTKVPAVASPLCKQQHHRPSALVSSANLIMSFLLELEVHLWGGSMKSSGLSTRACRVGGGCAQCDGVVCSLGLSVRSRIQLQWMCRAGQAC